jgi:competence protein ComEA
MVRTLCSLAVLGVLLSAQPHAQAAQSPKAGDTGGKSIAVVNLNTASSAELQTLPGVGAKTAERIIEYRQKKGPFKKIEELMNVQGIGEKSFLKLRAQVTVAAKGSRAEQQD